MRTSTRSKIKGLILEKIKSGSIELPNSISTRKDTDVKFLYETLQTLVEDGLLFRRDGDKVRYALSYKMKKR